jgi:hypothetical protein
VGGSRFPTYLAVLAIILILGCVRGQQVAYFRGAMAAEPRYVMTGEIRPSHEDEEAIWRHRRGG